MFQTHGCFGYIPSVFHFYCFEKYSTLKPKAKTTNNANILNGKSLCLWPYFPPINHLVRILLLLYYLCHKPCRDKGIEMSFSLFDTLVILFRLIGQWLKLQSLIGTWYQIYFPGSCLWEWLRLCIWLWAKPQDSSGWLCASNWPVQTCWLFSSQSGLLLLWRKGSTWLRYSDVPRTEYGLWQHPVSHLALSVGQKLIPCRFLSASFFWITFP